MWNTEHSKNGWNLNEESHTEVFILYGLTCYHDLLTGKYYTFSGITGQEKIEAADKDQFTSMVAWLKVRETMKNNNWIPVSSGLYPDDREDVQVTYLGWNDHKPYCNEFAYRLDSKWLWSTDDSEVKVEIIAWRYNCEPYVPANS